MREAKKCIKSVGKANTGGLSIKAGLPLAVAATLACGVQNAGAQSAYPNQPIRVIVAFGAGSATDITFRRLEPLMSRSLGQQLVIENRPGAVGMIGAEAVKRARPDGYTVLFTAASHSIQAAMRPKSLPFDAVRDFTPIGRAFTTSGLVAMNPSVPVHNIKELIEYSKGQPKGLSFAAGGFGSSHHLQGEALKARGANLVLVPYVKIAQGISDVIGGHVPMMIYATDALTPHVKAGRLRAIAVNSEKRQKELPDVPTILDQGYKGTGSGSWSGLLGPAGLALPVRNRLYSALESAVTDPQTQKTSTASGLEAGLLPPDEFRAFMENDITMWAEVVRQAKLPLDQAPTD